MRRQGLWLWAFLPILLVLSLGRLYVCQGESSFEEYDDYDEEDLERDELEEPTQPDDADYALPEMEFIQDDGPHRVRFQDTTGDYHVIPIPPHLLTLPEDEMLEETMLLARSLQQWPVALDDYDLAIEEAKDYMHPSDRRQRERTILTLFFHAVKGGKSMREEGRWLDEYTDYCDWSGITCGVDVDGQPYSDYVLVDYEGSSPPPDDTVTKIELQKQHLSGTLPTELAMLDHLQILDLSTNRLRGTIPENYVYLTQLRALDFSYNTLTGSIPADLGVNCVYMEAVSLTSNHLSGPLPSSMSAWTDLWYFDIGRNDLTGTISSEIGIMTNMQTLSVSDNLFTGTLPSELVQLTWMRLFDAGSNAFSGTLPSGMEALSENLWDFNVADNVFWGTLPVDLLGLTSIQLLLLSENMFSGTIPPGGDEIPGRPSYREPTGMKWSNLKRLKTLKLDDNELTGSIPAQFLFGLRSSVDMLELSHNQLTGTIATEIGLMSALGTINIISNRVRGTVPNEMLQLNHNLRLNFTDNLLTGTIPGLFCGEGAASLSMLYKENGCDAVLCRPGTFNTYGHATLYAACRHCPETEEGEKLDPPMSTVLGRTECNGTDFVHGDLDADGILSPREILRLIYVENLGRFWGATYQTWAKMQVNECDLAGITCEKGKITKIDLTAANLCSNGDRKPGPLVYCKGLPAEIGELSTLEALQLSRRQFLRGTLPTEIGKLSMLKLLDLSSCTSMKGSLPTELGLLTNLKYLVLSHSRFQGSLPEEMFHLTSLEKMHMTNNRFYGSLPTALGLMENLKEFMISRNYFSSTIPTEVGNLAKLENFEAYSNSMNGTLPSEMAFCTNLKRIDVFNNQLVGTIPVSLSKIDALQILHIKNNLFTGTIPSEVGELPYLSWFDASHNHLHGTIPASFGASLSIKDFRLANNMIYDPVPHALCANPNVNGGLTKQYGCDGVICSLGSYSDVGHATDADGGCKPCLPGETNLYLGSTTCRRFSWTEIMSLFFDVMKGDSWPSSYKTNWRDLTVDSCAWAGIACDASGEPVSLTFPLLGADDGSSSQSLPRWQK